MTSALEQVEYQLQFIKALIPLGESMQAYLAQTLDEQIVAASGETAMGIAMDIVPPSMLSPTQIYASARIAVELLDDPQQLAAKPEGIVDLGVIEWLLRPALPLQDNRFESITAGPWQHLTGDTVETLARSVCRLDLVVSGYLPMH